MTHVQDPCSGPVFGIRVQEPCWRRAGAVLEACGSRAGAVALARGPREALGGLGRRQALLAAAARASRRALGAAAVGLGAMVAHTELGALGPCQWRGCIFALELLMSSSTVALLFFLLLYHALVIQVSAWDAGARHWRAALGPRRAAAVALELALCALHPPPRWPLPSSEPCPDPAPFLAPLRDGGRPWVPAPRSWLSPPLPAPPGS
ncbi:intermediate conductance calcium-activated potassium channel protein 4-like [Apteryx mantelli]|uniref:Intermediate conductance calcium-activated potassium channel protein 4-like n=1 Tax=Apteryx mantelli TaxID=2696672 RepID=A0ABM4G754_9AVES